MGTGYIGSWFLESLPSCHLMAMIPPSKVAVSELEISGAHTTPPPFRALLGSQEHFGDGGSAIGGHTQAPERHSAQRYSAGCRMRVRLFEASGGDTGDGSGGGSQGMSEETGVVCGREFLHAHIRDCCTARCKFLLNLAGV